MKDVLIVGAGPTGLTLACSLAKLGLTFKIIDKREYASVIPRAINISNPTLSIMENLSISDEFWKNGIKLDEMTVYWKSQRLLNINYKYIEINHPYFFHIEQFKLEKLLQEILVKYNVSVERSLTLLEIEQNKNSVTAKIANKDGKVKQENFRYVVGCDGGNSTVRELLNITCQHKNYSSYFILADAELEHNFTKNNLRYYVGDNGYLIIAPLPDNKYRLIASFKDEFHGNENIDLSKRYFQKIVNERAAGNVFIRNIIWNTSANFYHKLADKSRKDRVFLAGDALHQFSPVGGTNMNTGIQDAFSLAEKISLAAKSTKSESFLQAYEAERLDGARKLILITEKMTRLLTQNNITKADSDKFLPRFKNRQFIKSTLPQLFSGVDVKLV